MDTRRELIINNKHERRFEKIFGYVVRWFVYDVFSPEDPVYDTGPQREYRTGIEVPTLWAAIDDPDENLVPEGRVPGRSMSFAFNVKSLRELGIPDPEDAFARGHDVLEFQGEFFKIREYEPSGTYGRSANQLSIEVKAYQVFDFDLPSDTFPMGMDPLGT